MGGLELGGSGRAGTRPRGWPWSEIPRELIPAASYVKGGALGCGGCN